MKGWQTACIPDQATFTQYTGGEEVAVSVIVYPEWIEDFQAGNKIEVFLESTTPGHSHFTGRITKNNGIIPSFPEGRPDVISINVQRPKV
jgi:hypothetical protein